MAANSKEQRKFARWVLNVGDSSLPAIAKKEGVDPDWIKISSHMRLPAEDYNLKRINPNCPSGSPTPLWRCHVSYVM
jgi:hypothetical protein